MSEEVIRRVQKNDPYFVEKEDRTGVILLSGGMDSCLVAAMAKRNGLRVTALCVSYGQRCKAEVAASQAIAAYLGIPWELTSVPLQEIVTSALHTRAPMFTRTLEELRADKCMSPAFVPNRNMVLLSLAIAYAQTHDLNSVLVGACLEDAAGFPDCRPEFFGAIQTAARVVTGNEKFKIITPVIWMEKAEIVRLSKNFNAPLELSVSCYQPVGDNHCGRCDACLLRRDAFKAAGVTDPTPYAVEL